MRLAILSLVLVAVSAVAGCMSAEFGQPVTLFDCAAIDRGTWRGFEADKVCNRLRLRAIHD